jgi:hypothetical protein
MLLLTTGIICVLVGYIFLGKFFSPQGGYWQQLSVFLDERDKKIFNKVKNFKDHQK